MRIRHDSAVVSSVLFTIALLWLVPWCWSEAAAGGFDVYFRPGPNAITEQPSPENRFAAQTLGNSELFP